MPLRTIQPELQLQQFLPHLFLRAAQEHDIAGKRARPGQHPAAEIDQLVDCRADRTAMTKIIAEIDDPVAIGEPRRDLIVQTSQPQGLAVDRRNRPDPPRAPQPGEFSVCLAAVHSALRAARSPSAGQAAESSCSTRWTAVVSSIRSTAANSRTSRSRAAW
jgi:hypothetical protein